MENRDVFDPKESATLLISASKSASHDVFIQRFGFTTIHESSRLTWCDLFICPYVNKDDYLNIKNERRSRTDTFDVRKVAFVCLETTRRKAQHAKCKMPNGLFL